MTARSLIDRNKENLSSNNDNNILTLLEQENEKEASEYWNQMAKDRLDLESMV